MVASKAAVNLHDRYIKVGVPYIVWVVSRLLNVTDGDPHVLLVREGRANRQITLSVSALGDTSLYKRIEANPPTD